MKKRFLTVLTVCFVLIFTATAAYAREVNPGESGTTHESYIQHKNKNHDGEAGAGRHGNKVGNNGNIGNIIIDDEDEDDDDYDEDDDVNENKNKDENKNKGKDHQAGNGNKGRKSPGYVAVTGITLSKTSSALTVKSWERLTAAVQPANATDIKHFWFSSNPRIVSVNPSGKITGLASGTAVIYVATRDGFKTASCTVTVNGSLVAQVRVTGVQLSNSTLNLDVGNGRQLTAAVIPGSASNKSVAWFSNNSNVATVNQNGYVYGVDDGTAVITVRTGDGEKTATCTVTVRHGNSDIHAASVSIIKAVSTLALREGTVKHLDAQVLPENASNKNLIWQTSDANIVSVDQNGNITGVHAGTAVVTVTTVDASKQDTCTVRVIPANEWVSVSGISLNLISTTIPVGFTDTLRYEIGPAIAADQDVRWSSSNSAVAAVNAFGRIEAKAAGTAVITVTTVDGGKTASCLVMVTPRISPPTRGILLNKTASTMLEGKFDYPAVVFYPANENNYSLNWTSSDTAVAVVDQNGRVTARAQGTVVITVTIANQWSASYIVSVVR